MTVLTVTVKKNFLKKWHYHNDGGSFEEEKKSYSTTMTVIVLKEMVYIITVTMTAWK